MMCSWCQKSSRKHQSTLPKIDIPESGPSTADPHFFEKLFYFGSIKPESSASTSIHDNPFTFKSTSFTDADEWLSLLSNRSYV